VSLRARIVCSASVAPERLLERLRLGHWWPGLAQDHPELLARRDEILLTLAPDDLILVKETLLATIYDADTRTWGLLNSPVQDAYVVRLFNRHPTRLKAAVARLVSQLQARDGSDWRVHFPERVEVLEANSTTSAFWGKIMPERRMALAVSERYAEAGVGAWALALAVIFLIVSSPLGDPWVRDLGVGQAWHVWIEGVLERFSSAALVTATVSWAEVLFHWMAIRRLPLVEWRLD
jgi:hypothetical protein